MMSDIKRNKRIYMGEHFAYTTRVKDRSFSLRRTAISRQVRRVVSIFLDIRRRRNSPDELEFHLVLLTNRFNSTRVQSVQSLIRPVHALLN